MLDSVSDEVWRADDVLGWVYEYYNVKLLEELRRKGREEGLEAEDVPAANQFYTPHWVVRMLTDNSLGKRYLEGTGELDRVIEQQRSLSPEQRKERSSLNSDAGAVGNLCTYLVPGEEASEADAIENPSEIRVIDPACGSGHFLLYAFDVLEQIWQAERPEIDPAQIPTKILENNIYGIDVDLRACQLAAFNLYLKARTRAKEQGEDDFELPNIGIVCSDATIAEVKNVDEVFQEVSSTQPGVESALRELLHEFENVHGIGSLLDVRGTLSEQFLSQHSEVHQTTLSDNWNSDFTLQGFINTLQNAIEDQRDSNSFLARDLRSFLRLLSILAQDYDVALMNPPYGAQKKMPDSVKHYVEEQYDYPAEYYINFFEVCDRMTKEDGRIGMLVPRSFMFKRSFEDFRSDFVGERGAFDFIAEFGLGVLDNATVRTVGTVVRSGARQTPVGTFLRLYDVDSEEKEDSFVEDCLSGQDSNITRIFEVSLSEFKQIPRQPLNYAIPSEVRQLHQSNLKLAYDENENESVCEIAQGLSTGDNPRFIREHWESPSIEYNYPYAKGGSDAWILPTINKIVQYRANGREMRPLPGSVLRNTQHYGKEGLTWTYIKNTGRRFGFLPEGCIFDHTGSMIFPGDNIDIWSLLSVLNTDLYHGLFLSLTPDRHWTPGVVSRIPWFDQFNSSEKLATIAEEQYKLKLEGEVNDPASPLYLGPELLPAEQVQDYFYDYHHFTDSIGEHWDLSLHGAKPSQSLVESSRQAVHEEEVREYKIEQLAQEAENQLCAGLDVSQQARSEVCEEIELRTAERIGNRRTTEPEAPDPAAEPNNYEYYVKKLVHHLVLDRLTSSNDGIIPVKKDGANDRLIDEVVAAFEKVFSDYASDRLQEADQALGEKPPEQEPYPNLRKWLSNDLFEFHLEEMENTPLFWRITSKRLVTDEEVEGFGCYVYSRKVDSGIFDRLTTRYIEPRTAELRQARDTADRKRTDDSLSTSEQAEAAEQYSESISGLQQIEQFREEAQQLADFHPRDWDEDDISVARQLKPEVREFREETSQYLEILDQLGEENDEQWFEDTFSPTFYSTVSENREEWIAGLKEVGEACEAYTSTAEQSVAAHHYDMLTYFDDLTGSDHYSSNGILFMTYYFEREGSKFLNSDGEPKSSLSETNAELLAKLASGLDSYKQQADHIAQTCSELTKRIPSDWEDRAISQIMTEGYTPVQKHGVKQNLKPLADSEIVPKIVDNKVL
jgi:hypothetical protein